MRDLQGAKTVGVIGGDAARGVVLAEFVDDVGELGRDGMPPASVAGP